ncbi:MAG TPA: hypothetical protein VFU05_18050 [Cyclobacteriaceae bacterium]|nr:hypothetical protein [Cyclobacteriaceae bacterium]
MKNKIFLIPLLIVVTYYYAHSQSTVSAYEASNPTYIRSHVRTSFESYNYYETANFYSIQLGYYYGIGERHLAGISIPFYHNVFNADFAGYENTTGIGDIRMFYMLNAFNRKVDGPGLKRVSPFLEVSAPTGEYELGRGAGAWLYKPGIIFSYSPIPEVSFYPEIKYQFSINETNGDGSSDGMPDPEDPVKEGKYQNLAMNFPVVMILKEWDGWFSLNAQYAHSFTEKVDFFFLRMDVGKMLGEYTSGALNISKFIAGQPRLNVVVQAKFNFYLGR